MTAELATALTRFAEADLKLARAKGEIIVSETQRGNLWLRHESAGIAMKGGRPTHHPAGNYTLTEMTTGRVIATGKAAAVKAALISCYAVEIAAV